MDFAANKIHYQGGHHFCGIDLDLEDDDFQDSKSIGEDM
jgi:hypothetical protein